MVEQGSPLALRFDERTTAILRLLLGVSALLVTGALHGDPALDGMPLLVVLVSHCAYASVLYLLARRGTSIPLSATHWIDLAWYTAFVVLGGGTGSPFFSFYYFAILLASFRGGFWPGMRVAVASALLFSIAGYVSRGAGDDLLTERAILRSAFVLIIGAMMARAGDLELRLKRRLILLREVSALANPRFGAAETVGLIVERLRAAYGADAAVLAVASDRDADSLLFRTDPRSHGAIVDSGEAADGAVRLLTAIDWTRAVLLRKQTAKLFHVTDDGITQSAGERTIDEWTHRVASLLECRSFVSVPVRYDARSMARLCLASRKAAAFAAHDLDLLMMVFEHVRPTLERLRILDTFATDVASTERRRVADDLHDAVIQPWVGIQMGIAAALHHSRTQEPVAPMLEHLLDLTSKELEQLRKYTRGFRTAGEGHAALVDGIRQIAARFSSAADIAVEVDAPEPLAAHERLAREVFHIVAEGLSNIRRHTEATHASIEVHRERQDLCVRIENPGACQVGPRSFTPRSIHERVARLGGVTTVHADAGTTVVNVRIPL